MSTTKEKYKKVAYYPGCALEGTGHSYNRSTKAVGKKLGKDKGNSKYLYGLFPYGPGKQACRYAGLPKPTGCV